MLAIIGGSGLTQLSSLDIRERKVIRTPYGEPSGVLSFGRLDMRDVLFLPRHGYGHNIPPHRVNYRANIWALKECGARCIVSIASVGGIRADLNPGDIVIPHQIMDYTWGRKSTYFDGTDMPVKHVDFTHPYDEELRRQLVFSAAAAGISVWDGGVYAATQGPRLETAAEIDRLERDGAEVVGMTGMPEAVLARELELAYAAINPVANHAAGRGKSAESVRFEHLGEILQEVMGRVRIIVEGVIGVIGKE
ncbi:MAG: S-methyl-5'-thioinosine phosphorylase [Zoogloeaceae bacterium]|jgi:5'-methylthioadenosine phosphorylase|nr:S-methyl-5'-thioinosine phosphorylase [Zoogloeaceae bacterium]